MAECESAMQVLDLRRGHVGHEPHAAHGASEPVVHRDNARRFLAAMLEGEQPELRQADCIIMTADPKDATHQTTESDSRATSCALALRCMMDGIASWYASASRLTGAE